MTHTKTEYHKTLETAYFLLKEQIDTYGDPSKVSINVAETVLALIRVADKLYELNRVWID